MTGFLNGWLLAFRLARRELRGGIQGFRILIACLALGVASIAAVGSISSSVTEGLARDGQALLGGDIQLRKTHIAPEAEHLDYIQNRSKAFSETTEMRAMAARTEDRTRRALVELKGVDGNYPMAGTLDFEPPMSLEQAFSKTENDVFGGLVEPALMAKLDLQLGSLLRVGETVVEVRGVINREPDRVATVMSFGPRLMVSNDAVQSSGLIRPGSQIRYATRVLLDDPGTRKGWVEDFRDAFPEAAYRIQTTDNAAPGVRRFVERLRLFLTFIGLTAVLVGGIGVGNAVAAYLDSRNQTIATYKSLGAPSNLIVRIFLLQVTILGGLGIGIGLALGAILPALGLWAAQDLFPVRPVIGLYPASLLEAMVFGFLIAWTFALVPLGRASRVRPVALFRAAVAPITENPPVRYWAYVSIGAIALIGLTFATAYNPRFALTFVLGAVGSFLVLRAAALLILALAENAPISKSAVWRLVLANLHRPGNATNSVVLSLGLGLTVLVSVGLIEANLNRQIDERLPDKAPAFFFLDIQPNQVEDFDKTVKAVPGASAFERVASLRGRITRIDDVPVDQVEIAPNARWAVRGDRALTYSATPRPGSRIVDGTWWPDNYSGPPLISIDSDLADGFGVEVGDTLTLNILGRDITAEIASTRAIDWRQLRFDFAIIFSPGVLEGAPHSHIAAIHVPPEREADMDRALAVGFDNVSTIRVRDALDQAARMVDGIGWAVRATAAFTLLTGVLVLAGAIAATHRRRTFETVVFKVLGASGRRVTRVFVMEYGLLSLATAALASLIGIGISWFITTRWMGLDWVMKPEPVLWAVGLSVIAVLGLGLWGTRLALQSKPLSHLRNA